MTGNRPVFYWDTCLFVAWLADEKRKSGELDSIREMIERFKRREISLMTSALTIAEMSLAKVPVGTYSTLEDVMQRPNFSRLSVDIRIAKLAREVRDHYVTTHQDGHTLSPPDAIHVATAIAYRANEFHTFDGKDKPSKKCLGLLPLSGNVAGHALKICVPHQPIQMGIAFPAQQSKQSTSESEAANNGRAKDGDVPL